MSILVWLMILWGLITVILALLMIYRGTVTMHEDDQLFLDEAESHMQKEQTEVLKKLNWVNPLVRVFGGASGLLALVIIGLWLYQSLFSVQYAR